MIEYTLRVKVYSPPDRGDPERGWYPIDPLSFEAEDDEAAIRHAREHIGQVCKGRDASEIKATLTRIVSFDIWSQWRIRKPRPGMAAAFFIFDFPRAIEYILLSPWRARFCKEWQRNQQSHEAPAPRSLLPGWFVVAFAAGASAPSCETSVCAAHAFVKQRTKGLSLAFESPPGKPKLLINPN